MKFTHIHLLFGLCNVTKCKDICRKTSKSLIHVCKVGKAVLIYIEWINNQFGYMRISLFTGLYTRVNSL